MDKEALRLGAWEKELPRKYIGVAFPKFLGAVGFDPPETERRCLLGRAGIRLSRHDCRIVRCFQSNSDRTRALPRKQRTGAQGHSKCKLHPLPDAEPLHLHREEGVLGGTDNTWSPVASRAAASNDTDVPSPSALSRISWCLSFARSLRRRIVLRPRCRVRPRCRADWPSPKHFSGSSAESPAKLGRSAECMGAVSRPSGAYFPLFHAA